MRNKDFSRGFYGENPNHGYWPVYAFTLFLTAVSVIAIFAAGLMLVGR